MIANSEQVIEYTSVRITTYKFIVYVITTRPTAEFVEEICSLSFEGFPLLQRFVYDYGQQNAEDLSIKLAVDWTRTFREIKPGYGPPPARASAYRSFNISELIKTYSEAGLEVAPSQFDPDYIGIQLAFLYELIEQELKYLEQGKMQQASILQREQKDFIKCHLDWVSDFCHQAESGLELPFYRGILLLMQEFLDEDLQWLQGGKAWN